MEGVCTHIVGGDIGAGCDVGGDGGHIFRRREHGETQVFVRRLDHQGVGLEVALYSRHLGIVAFGQVLAGRGCLAEQFSNVFIEPLLYFRRDTFGNQRVAAYMEFRVVGGSGMVTELIPPQSAVFYNSPLFQQG